MALGFLLTRYTGLRIGELCAVRKADFRMDEQYLVVSHTLQRLPVEEAARLMSLSLSAAAAPASASSWIEGFLNQSALVLLHDDALWGVLANWLDSLNDTHFTNILPMLRRTFSGFSAPERRQLGERAKRAAGKPMQKQAETRWDAERAALPVPLLRRVLGLTAQA